MKKYQTAKSALKSLKGLQKVRRHKLTYSEACTLESYFTAMGYDEYLIELAKSTLHRDKLTHHICFVSADQYNDFEVYFYIDSIEPNNSYKQPMRNCNSKFGISILDGIFVYKQGFKYFLCNKEQYDFINMDDVALVGNKKQIKKEVQ